MAVTYNDSGQGNTIGSNNRGVLYTNYTADGPQIQFMDHAGNLVHNFGRGDEADTMARSFLDSELTYEGFQRQGATNSNTGYGNTDSNSFYNRPSFAETYGNGRPELRDLAQELPVENLTVGQPPPVTEPNFAGTGPGANAGGIVPAPAINQPIAGKGGGGFQQPPLPDGGNFMLPQPLPGAGVANTRAIGEDNSMLQPNNPNAFTRAIGEDGNFGGAIATTMAIGENGSTFPPDGPGQGQLTTMAMGEETGGPPGQLPPPMGGATTQAMGEEEGQPGFPGQPTPPDMHPPGLFPQPPVAPPMQQPIGGKGGGGFQQPPAYQRPPNPFMGGGYGGYGGGFGGFGGGFGGGFQPQPYQQPYQPRPVYQPQPYGGGFGGGGKGGGGGFQPQPFMPQQPYQQPYQPEPQQPGGKGGGGGFGAQNQLFGMQNRQNAQNQQMFDMQNASPNGQQMQAQPAPAGTGGASPFGSMLGAAAGGGSGNRTALF